MTAAAMQGASVLGNEDPAANLRVTSTPDPAAVLIKCKGPTNYQHVISRIPVISTELYSFLPNYLKNNHVSPNSR